MLFRLTPTHLRALAGFARQPGWVQVEEVFQAELKTTVEKLLTARDDAELRQLQGRAKFITEFLSEVAGAEAALKRSAT